MHKKTKNLLSSPHTQTHTHTHTKVSYALDICRTCQKQMPPDELEIYGRHYAKIVIYLKKTLRIYYDH